MQAWLHEFGADAAAFAFAALLVIAYYAALLARTRRDPTSSIHGVNEVARGAWVRHVMANPAKDIMAVQTLRNFVMGATLMATTAVLLILGTLSLTGQAETISRSWHVAGLYGSSAPGLWIVKVILLLADFIVAFFAFAMAIRLANHVVFMVNVPEAQGQAELAPGKVAERLNDAGRQFSTGMRAFLFAVPLVFWLFGPVFLVVAAVGLVLALHRIDRVPAS